MKNRIEKLIILLLLFSIASGIVSADIGPKPSADIHITLNGQNILDSSFNAKMLVCQNEENRPSGMDIIPQFNISDYDSADNCYWGPAGFVSGGNCHDSICHFGYFVPYQFRLAVYLPSEDKAYLSAKISKKSFTSTFEAELLPDGAISIYETTPFIQWDSTKAIGRFLIALIFTLILELIVAMVFVSIAKIPKKVLIAVLTANIISLPIVWFVFTLIMPDSLAILLGEVFAFVFEGYFIHLLNKKIIPLKKSFLLSAIMNIVSLIIGGFIFMLFSMMFYLLKMTWV